MQHSIVGIGELSGDRRFPKPLNRCLTPGNAAGRSASIIVPLFVGPVFTQYGVAGVLSIMGAGLLIMVIVVASLGGDPDRKASKTSVSPRSEKSGRCHGGGNAHAARKRLRFKVSLAIT